MKRIYTLSKTMAFLFSCMALIGTASSCADDYNTDPLTKNTILSSITIDEKYEVYTLVKGENYTLHFSTLPEDATNPGVSWVSGNEEVATVDANGKEATRAAVREIMAINSIADAVLRAQFEAIRNANRAIAAARESAKNIALARAYGAETRDYIPLMMLLGAPISFDQRRSIPAEWLQANSEKVLAAFKEQGQAVAAAKKATPRAATKAAPRK
jgi:hypothetical protein